MTPAATPAVLPPGACDCHLHVFDPAYPLAATASAAARQPNGDADTLRCILIDNPQQLYGF